MTVEQLIRFENYYFADEELFIDDLEFIISNSKNLPQKLKEEYHSRSKYDVRDYFKIYGECDVIDTSRKGYSFSARCRCIEHSNGRKKQYIDFKNNKFNPLGNPITHTVTVGDYCFKIELPFEYNFLIILLKWSDEMFERGEFPVNNAINAPLVSISADTHLEYGLTIDRDFKVPLAIGYAEVSFLDEMYIRPQKPLKGGIFLYKSKTLKQGSISVSLNISEDRKTFLPDVELFVLRSPYDDGIYSLYDKYSSYSLHITDKIRLLGDSDNFLLYVCVERTNKEIIEMRFFTLKDYYTMAAWLIDALSLILYSRDYWPTIYMDNQRLINHIFRKSPLYKYKEDADSHYTRVENSNDRIVLYSKSTTITTSNRTEISNNEAHKSSKTSTEKTDVMAELESLIGLGSIKKDVKDLISLVKMQKMRQDKGLKSIPLSLHLVFTGNPGTGKTTVARILAQLYKEIGVLKKGQIVEVDRADLVAGYVGQTAIKTQEKIQEALGGILFIDEAYTLAKDGNDYGQEAIDTILKEMEDSRENFVVIVAGYDDLMQKFINSNPGLKSRFNKYFHFPDYSADELIEIFRKIIHKYDYTITEEAMQTVAENIRQMEKNKGENFANARDIRNYFEQIVTHQATRIASLSNSESADILEIVPEDL